MTTETNESGSRASRPVLELPASIETALVAEARAAAPAECCGVLGGVYDTDASRVCSYYPTPNAANTPRTRYLIDPETQFAVFETIEAEGESIVGFYHSHPRGPSRPSATDRDAATWPDRSYVIVSLASVSATAPVVRSWRWRGDRFERECLEITESANDPS